jgi:hypothetical protein
MGALVSILASTVGVRFFISQVALDGLVEKESALLEGERLLLPSRQLLAPVEAAVYFVREVEGKPDPQALVGKVKTVESLAVRGADHFRASVMLGDNAYDVVEGYLATAPDGWSWPNGSGVADEIPVEIDVTPVAAAAPEVEPAAAAVRMSAIDVTQRPAPAGPVDHFTDRPGFRAPGPPPPEAREEPLTPRRASRPPPGLSRLPVPTPGNGVRPSRPPPAPGKRQQRPTAPDLPREAASTPPPASSPSRTADDLERILLETIRPTRGKRR